MITSPLLTGSDFCKNCFYKKLCKKRSHLKDGVFQFDESNSGGPRELSCRVCGFVCVCIGVYTVLDGDLLAHFLELSLEEQEAVCEACGEGGVTATEVAQLIDALLHLTT